MKQNGIYIGVGADGLKRRLIDFFTSIEFDGGPKVNGI